MFSNSCRRPARDGHLTAVTAPVLQLFACHKLLALSFKREKLEKKKKKGYICDVGSWQLPEVPLAPIREMAAPRGAGKPQGM